MARRTGWMTAGLGSRGRRLVSAAVAIVLGVAFLTASLAVLTTAQAGLEDAVAAGLRDADLAVVGGAEPVTAGMYDEAAALPGVDAVVGEALVLAGRTSSDHVPGTSIPAGGATLLKGVLPTGPTQVAVNPDLEASGASVGSMLTLIPAPADGGPGTPVDLAVVGVVDPGAASPLSFGGGFVAPDEVLRALDPGLVYDSLQVHLTPGADADSVRSALTEALPGTTVQTGAQAAADRVASLTGETAVLAAMLLGFGGVALVTAGIVIANTFTITLAQRAGELALLRCVGATTAQVRRLVLLEALVLGLVASLAGVAAGLGVAAALLALARRADLGIPLGTSLELTAVVVLVPVVVGVVVTLLASLWPSVRATRVSPLAALRPSGEVGSGRRVPWVRLAVGVVLMGLGTALMVHAATRHDVLAGLGGGVLSFAGVLVASAVLVPAAVRVAGLVARGAGVPGRLAVDNAVRNPGRAAATSAALLVGVTLITMTAVGAATAERSAMGEIDDAYAVDLVATPQAEGEITTGSPATTMAPDVPGRIAAVDGVAASTPVDAAYLQLGRQEVPTLALGLGPEASTTVRSPDQLAALEPGTIGLSSLLQAVHGLPVGDTVEVTGSQGTRTLTVVQLGLRDHLAVNEADLHALAGDQELPGAVLVRAQERADLGALMADLEQTLPDGAQLEGSLVERALITRVLDVLVLVTTALLGVAVVIAVVGIANTLSLSVIERQREHALLRGLGLTRGQMRGMLLTEGVLLAVVSAVIGLGLGLAYARLGVQTVLPDGTPVLLAVPWGRLGLILGVALVVGLLASVLPARRAARVTPAQGLAMT